jgi:hypothetical protein
MKRPAEVLDVRIGERLLYERFVTRAFEPEEVGERLTVVRRALECFAALVEVRALELERGFVDLDTGLWAQMRSLPPVLLARSASLGGATARSSVAAPEERALPACDPASLTRFVADALTELPPPAPRLLADWRRLEAVTVAARLVRAGTTLRLSPSRHLLVGEQDARGPWFCGPRAILGVPPVPPVSLAFEQDPGVVRLELAVGWSTWSEPGGPERAALDEARRGLLALGFASEG